jgi:hypothetical protein
LSDRNLHNPVVACLSRTNDIANTQDVVQLPEETNSVAAYAILVSRLVPHFIAWPFHIILAAIVHITRK